MRHDQEWSAFSASSYCSTLWCGMPMLNSVAPSAPRPPGTTAPSTAPLTAVNTRPPKCPSTMTGPTTGIVIRAVAIVSAVAGMQRM